MNAHLLNYSKAWVEIALPNDKWHLVSSPLQGTISGEMYAPTWSGQQETTYFEPINFDDASIPMKTINGVSYPDGRKYDRFAPAVYQRQWDKARAVLYERGAAWSVDDADQAAENDHSEGGQWSGDGQGYSWTNNSDEYLNRLVYKPFDVSKVNVAVRGSWSGAHNDHTVPYDNGGFSVMSINNLKEHNSNTETIIRLPKDDQYYDIWDWGKDYKIQRRVRVYIDDGREWPENLGELVQDAMGNYPGLTDPDAYMPNETNVITLENRGRLRSDVFASDLEAEYAVTLKNEGKGSMGYFLASNPFICGLDMEKFFVENADSVYPYYLVMKGSNIDPQMPELNPTDWKWTDMTYAGQTDGTNFVGNAVVPPRYAFFLKKKDNAAVDMSTLTLKYTADMMVSTPKTTENHQGGGAPNLRIRAERDGNTSEATVMLSPDASNSFLPEEDLETFVVSDISSKIPVIYTLTGCMATSINRIHDFMVLPIGIKVFAKDAYGNGNEYNVAKFTIIFDGGTETLPYMDIVGDTKRSPNALIGRCGNPKAHLNFDYPRTYGFTSPFQTTTEAMMAALPLEYSTTNYAYARRKGNIRLAAGWGSSGIGNTHSATASTNNNKTYIIRSINDYLSEQNTGIPYPNTNTNTTYDPGFLFVDASDMPGQVATVSFDGDFCEGSLLMCSGWMASLQGGFTITNGTINTSPGSVILTVMGRKPKGDGTYTEEEVYSFCPGQLPYHVRKADGSIIYPDGNKVFSNVGDFIWQQFYFEFYGNGSVEYYLKIDNNATSTDGGDYVLDDIWIFAVLPELETGSMLPLCGGELEMIRLENKYETLLNAVGIKEFDEENGEPEQTGYLNLTYIDWDRFVREFKEKVEAIDHTTYSKEEFLEKLEQEYFSDEIYEEDYRNVFDASLLKDDLDPTKVAYSCIKWSNKFDSDLHIPYTFDTFYNNSQDPESNINKVYYSTLADAIFATTKQTIYTF